MKKREIAFNFRNDGTIRAYQAQSKDKRGVPEINIICPINSVAPTVTALHPPFIYYEEAEIIQRNN